MESHPSDPQETPTADSSPENGRLASVFAPPDDALGRAFAAMRAAEDDKDAARKTQHVIDAIGELTEDQRRRLLADPAVQELIDRAALAGAESGMMKPGSEIRDRHGRLVGKVPWTPQTLKDHYEALGHPMIEWVPHRDQFISINGVSVYVVSGQKVTTPPAYKDLHDESHNADLNARRAHEEIMRQHFGDYGEVIDVD